MPHGDRKHHMIEYNTTPKHIPNISDGVNVPCFISSEESNIDWVTVKSFGEEWAKFHGFSDEEIKMIGDQYFDVVPSELLNGTAQVLDMGCGSGRWSRYLAPKVKSIEAIDPSDAVFQAHFLTKEFSNVRVTQASVDAIPFENNSFDLVFSLGVLHHIPDTRAALKKCVEKVKPGGYFLVYLYYSLDNRGRLFKSLFFLSNLLRLLVSVLPGGLKRVVCDIIAVTIYMPFVFIARLAGLIPFTRNLIKYIPLSYYRDKSFMVIRNDSLDRFGTPLEQRFSRKQIESMMFEAGLTEIKFSEQEPYWHAIGKKE